MWMGGPVHIMSVFVSFVFLSDSMSTNFRPPVVPGHERGAGERDPDVPLAVHGV